MATTNVQVQLQKAMEMKGTVQEFAAIIIQRMDTLNDMLENFVRGGFPEDIARTYYHNYYTPDYGIISDLNRKMLSDHVDFLDRVIADLKRAADRK